MNGKFYMLVNDPCEVCQMSKLPYRASRKTCIWQLHGLHVIESSGLYCQITQLGYVINFLLYGIAFLQRIHPMFPQVDWY
jgi:hypothetical protein